MTKSTFKKVIRAGLMSLGLVAVAPTFAFAANNSTLNQTISAGTLSTDILNGSLVPVASPAVSMSAKAFSFTCQSGGNASTGTLGTASERLYVTNGDAADAGWTLTIAATAGVTARWANGGATNHIDFNDPTTAGCADGADAAETTAGQLTIDPAAGSLTTDCLSCTTSNVTLGTSTGFVQGTTDTVTLINAGAASADVWRGYLTGVGLSQTIPAETPTDSYTINLTLTSTAS